MSLTKKIQDYKKFQESDFEGKGTRRGRYFGPIYSVEFPASCDPVSESFTWSEFGYIVGASTGNFGESFSIPIYGEIPKFFIEKLEEAGAKIKLVKPRNKESVNI